MPRRPHRKSRNGCLACKKRHVKCNEGRPTCLKCRNAQLTCTYPDKAQIPSSSQSSAPGISSIPSPAATTSLSTSIPTSSCWSPASNQPALEHGAVNMLHLELLHHARTATYEIECYGISKEDCHHAVEEILQHAVSTPYLMYEILSISAKHLSTIHSHRQPFLRHLATELQTSALSMFNAQMQSPHDENCTPDYVSRFIFASFLGSHMLHDTIGYGDGDFTVFLNNFVQYLHVTKGVHLNLQGTWELLHETALKPLLVAGTKALRGGSETVSPECEKLEELFKSADLSPSSSKAYESAVSFLRAAYHAHRQAVDERDNFDASPLLYGARTSVYAWPILVPIEYVELVQQRRPEALAVLAHYAILLHRYRYSWTIGDGGRFMIEGITKYLGPYWEPWLASPNQELRADISPGGPSSQGGIFF